MPINLYKNKKIITFDKNSNNNGYLIPIYNDRDGVIAIDQKPAQIYLTVVNPGMIKGPHLHKTRWGLFTCIKGNIKIIIKTPNGYQDYFSGEDYDYQTVQVPAGYAAALQNTGVVEAFVLNMPSPAWSQQDPDDHPISFHDYKF